MTKKKKPERLTRKEMDAIIGKRPLKIVDHGRNPDITNKVLAKIQDWERNMREASSELMRMGRGHEGAHFGEIQTVLGMARKLIEESNEQLKRRTVRADKFKEALTTNSVAVAKMIDEEYPE